MDGLVGSLTIRRRDELSKMSGLHDLVMGDAAWQKKGFAATS